MLGVCTVYVKNTLLPNNLLSNSQKYYILAFDLFSNFFEFIVCFFRWWSTAVSHTCLKYPTKTCWHSFVWIRYPTVKYVGEFINVSWIPSTTALNRYTYPGVLFRLFHIKKKNMHLEWEIKLDGARSLFPCSKLTDKEWTRHPSRIFIFGHHIET